MYRLDNYKALVIETITWRYKTPPNLHMYNCKKIEKIGNKLSPHQMGCYLLGTFMKRQNEVLGGGRERECSYPQVLICFYFHFLCQNKKPNKAMSLCRNTLACGLMGLITTRNAFRVSDDARRLGLAVTESPEFQP